MNNNIWEMLATVNRTGPQGRPTPFGSFLNGVAQALIVLARDWGS